MRRRRPTIDIKEPPLREIKKTHSCFRRSCTTGCGCLFFIIFLFLLFFKFFVVSQPKTLKQIPDNFPESIPAYDTEHIEKISYISGEKKNKTLLNIGRGTQNIFGPIARFVNRPGTITGETLSKIKFDDVMGFIAKSSPVTYDIIYIEWRDLPAEPNFIKNFFSTRLSANLFTIAEGYTKEGTYDLSFGNKTINGTLHIDDNPRSIGTDKVMLTVRIPTQ